MGDSHDDDKPEGTTDDARAAERRKEFTRRALLQAGWTAPLIMTVNGPSAFAQSPVPHTDHVDTPHTDHVDAPHADTAHTDHVDAPHADTAHTNHVDAPHQDHQDHTDVPTPHSDIPHVDAGLIEEGPRCT